MTAPKDWKPGQDVERFLKNDSKRVQDRDGDWEPVNDWLAYTLLAIGILPWTVIAALVYYWWRGI